MIQMGEELTVSFDIDARQWQDRWFNSIRAWKVERVSAATGSACNGSTGSAARSVRSAGILIRRRKGRLAFLI